MQTVKHPHKHRPSPTEHKNSEALSLGGGSTWVLVRSFMLQLGAVWLLGVPKDDPVVFYRLYDFILDMKLTQIHDVQTLSSHTAGAV